MQINIIRYEKRSESKQDWTAGEMRELKEEFKKMGGSSG